MNFCFVFVVLSFKIQFCEVLAILDVTYALNPVSKRFSCTYLAFEKETWVIVIFCIIRHFAHCYCVKVVIQQSSAGHILVHFVCYDHTMFKEPPKVQNT